METELAGWTKENLLKFLASLKASIPKQKKSVGYRKELETVDWNEVALPPFSPEECQEKWSSIMKNIPKIRTLTELISEAEHVILNPSHNPNIHPELPKRPPPPLAAFFQENFAQLKNEHPRLKSAELIKISNKRFSNLSAEEKAKYGKKRRLAFEEYKTELKRLENKGYGKLPTRLRHGKKKTVSSDIDCNGDEHDLPPKPITNGYLLFCKEHSKSIRHGQKDGMMHEWSKAWKELSETEKKKYLNQGKDMKRQYAIKLCNYLKRFDEEQQNKILQENSISRSVLQMMQSIESPPERKLSNEPKMPSTCPRTAFISEQMKLLKEVPLPKDRLIQVNKMWQNLSSKEKECHKAKVDGKFRRYADELQKWFQNLSSEDQQLYLEHNSSKLNCLALKSNEMFNKEELHMCQPSDSEDEDIMISSSSDEEGNFLNLEEEEDEEEEDEDEEEGNMFEMY